MAVERKLMTIEEFDQFAALPENRDRTLELINGEVIEMMPTEEHGAIALIFGAELHNYLKAHPIGRAGVEVRHQAPGDHLNALQPDVSFTRDTGSALVRRGAVPHMPDLAIEIKSPDDTFTQMRDKARYYLEHGSQRVWLVYPEQRIVEVYAQGVDSRMLTQDDTLDGGDLLPGFLLAVRDVFRE